ncbi:hypothetical protein [Burkholderia pseudomallei]|uniref:hypothetical protein n=1 Tax=Burkholderia pseudomallei TaxID=28450 RepID=UPI000A1A3036|nr:hypothetical protein [Burkholderia pseudomallei]ARL04264.1 hypothetical protein BOC44_21070 [Burkholderia pseudomallei]
MGQQLGKILGSVALPVHVIAESAKLADEMFSAAEEQAFCGDAVETWSIPAWALRDGAAWLPDLEALGYRRAKAGEFGRERQELLVATPGVEQHADDEGLVLMVVLHNDGLMFKQGRVKHVPNAGDWFVFDDRKDHGVDGGTDHGREMFVGWNIPIDRI